MMDCFFRLPQLIERVSQLVMCLSDLLVVRRIFDNRQRPLTVFDGLLKLSLLMVNAAFQRQQSRALDAVGVFSSSAGPTRCRNG